VGFIKWETTRRISYDSNGIKQPWQRMIMVRKPENGFLSDTVLSEVDYSNNQLC
jgi:hypothetical protein